MLCSGVGCVWVAVGWYVVVLSLGSHTLHTRTHAMWMQTACPRSSLWTARADTHRYIRAWRIQSYIYIYIYVHTYIHTYLFIYIRTHSIHHTCGTVSLLGFVMLWRVATRMHADIRLRAHHASYVGGWAACHVYTCIGTHRCVRNMGTYIVIVGYICVQVFICKSDLVHA